jgi:hypothetical protein
MPKVRVMKFLFGKIIISILSFVCITSVHAATNFVWRGSPAPTAPYSTWETAAHVIQDAVDAAIAGDVVLVTNDVYDTGLQPMAGNMLDNRVMIDKSITVTSVNGPEHTRITGLRGTVMGLTNAVRCVYLTNGGGTLLTEKAILSNCIVRFNFTEVYGGGIYCETGATIIDCIVCSNTSGAFG